KDKHIKKLEAELKILTRLKEDNRSVGEGFTVKVPSVENSTVYNYNFNVNIENASINLGYDTAYATAPQSAQYASSNFQDPSQYTGYAYSDFYDGQLYNIKVQVQAKVS
ncbi:LOW QUALITY PROTEIN: hypothetical protein HJC23_000906, partial [Cyclotella cryptica]